MSDAYELGWSLPAGEAPARLCNVCAKVMAGTAELWQDCCHRCERLWRRMDDPSKHPAVFNDPYFLDEGPVLNVVCSACRDLIAAGEGGSYSSEPARWTEVPF